MREGQETQLTLGADRSTIGTPDRSGQDLDRPKCENGRSETHIENEIIKNVWVKIDDIWIPKDVLDLDGYDAIHTDEAEIRTGEMLKFRPWSDANKMDLFWNLENKGNEFFDENPKVWKRGNKYICLDGRMRIEVYSKKYLGEKTVPVDVAVGSLNFVKANIHYENSKPNKPYTKEEKDQLIWELLIEDYDYETRVMKNGTKTEPYKYSEKFFQTTFGVSERSIRRKRGELKKLAKEGKNVPLKYLHVKWGIDAEKEVISLEDMREMMTSNFKRMELERIKINNPFNSRKHIAEIYLASLQDSEAKDLIAKYYTIETDTSVINQTDLGKRLKSRLDNVEIETVEMKTKTIMDYMDYMDYMD